MLANDLLTAEELQGYEGDQQRAKLDQFLLERLRSREFTAREIEILQTGKSNAAYHYLGSSKIMARIGKAFANAMPIREK